MRAVAAATPGNKEAVWGYEDEILTDPRRHVIDRGGRRTGKSKRGAKRVFTQKIVLPNTRGWIVGPSYDLAHKEFRYIREFVEVLCRMQGVPKPEGVRESPGSGDLYLKTPWGAEVIGKSAQKPETLVGEELDWVLMSEPAMHKEQTWERYIRPTLSTRGGISVWPFTPDAGGLWLYELELAAQGLPDWGCHHIASWDCPFYDPKEIAAAKRELSDDAFQEQYGGEWRFYTGRVYRSFQPDRQMVEPFAIPGSWKVYAATDFGLRDATCTLWIAQAPTGEGYVIGEYYDTSQERATPDHAGLMLAKERELGVRPLVRIADHHGLGAQLIVDIGRAGWKTVSCQSNDRRVRRDRALTIMAPKLRPAPYHVRERGANAVDGGMYSDLFIFKRRCPNLTRELQFLRWKEGSRQEGSHGATEGDDHAVDPLEYILEYGNFGTHARSQRNKRVGQSVYRPAFGRTGY